MREPYRKRLISQPPGIQRFKPCGVARGMLKTITLSIDQFEAIRLADQLGLDHQTAADRMDISRPTFTRLIEKARHLVGRALVEGMQLEFHGGNVDFINLQHRCRHCGDIQTAPREEKISACRGCGSRHLDDLSRQYLTNGTGAMKNRKNVRRF